MGRAETRLVFFHRLLYNWKTENVILSKDEKLIGKMKALMIKQKLLNGKAKVRMIKRKPE